MRKHLFDDTIADSMLKKAEQFMASGRWTQAESILRECCINRADLNIRLAQLEWRRQCVEYANGLNRDDLGMDGVKQALTNNYDSFVADWVINEYKG